MNVEHMMEWITALRSGKYEQGQKALRVGNKFCCLGVACDLYDKNGWLEPCDSGRIPFHDEVSYLPLAVQERLGLHGHNPWGLGTMNDEGWTFAEIAAYLQGRLHSFLDTEPRFGSKLLSRNHDL